MMEANQAHIKSLVMILMLNLEQVNLLVKLMPMMFMLEVSKLRVKTSQRLLERMVMSLLRVILMVLLV